MFKKMIFTGILSMVMLGVMAQEEKLRVAVFDPTSSGTAIDEGTKVAVREIVSSTFVNTGKYTIVERSLLDKVMKEQQFSNTDNVDESQATELGRLAGANKVVLSVVTLVGGRNMLSVKMIDVKTATIDQQKTKIVGANDLLDIVEPLTLELMGEKVSTKTIQTTASSQSSSASTNNNEVLLKQIPSEGEISFYFEGCKDLAKEEHGKYMYTLFLDKVAIGTFSLKEVFWCYFL